MQAKDPQLPRSPLAVIFLTITLDLIGFAMVVPLLPLYAEAFGASAGQVTALFAGYSLMQFLCAPTWGRLSDRVGRRPVLLGSIAATALAMAVCAMATHYWVLLAGRLMAGAFTANIAVAQAYVADVTTPAQRARGMGVVGAAFGLGFVVGPFVGGEMSQWGLGAPAWLAAVLSACNGLLAFVYLPESRPAAARQQLGGARAMGLGERLRALRGGQLPRRLLALMFLQQAGFCMLEVAIVLFVRARLGLGALAVGRMFAGMGLAMAVVQGLGVGRLSRRLGEVPLVRLGLALTTLGMLVLPAAAGLGAVGLAAVLMLLTVGQGLVGPCLSALVSRWAGRGQQGQVLAVGQSLGSLARVAGPWAAGMAIEHGGVSAPFVLGGLVVALAVVLSWARPLASAPAAGALS